MVWTDVLFCGCAGYNELHTHIADMQRPAEHSLLADRLPGMIRDALVVSVDSSSETVGYVLTGTANYIG